MDEIIRVQNSSYKRYEDLLLRRDRLKKEAFHWEREYTARFGELILAAFEKKLSCIRKKKTITYYQMMINSGKPVDQEKLQAYLQEEMAGFTSQLEEMMADYALSKERTQLSPLAVLEIKRIYHRLVKLIHPDINPKTEEIPQLSQLWEKVQIAYRCNQLEELKEAEFLINKAMSELKLGEVTLEIPDLAERILQVEEQIQQILETNPYQYRFLLGDEEKVEQKEKELIEEQQSFTEYEKQLDEIMEGLVAEGVNFKWRMN